MEITVTPKKWYVVSGAAGSTISTPEGVVIATVPDGGQASFYATTYTVEASDDSTEVVEATFKYAPAKLKALGVFGRGETLPAGYLPALFLEGTGNSYFKTDIICSENTDFECLFMLKDTQNRPLFGTEPKDVGDFCVWFPNSTQIWVKIGNEQRYVNTPNNKGVKVKWRFSKDGVERDDVLIQAYSTAPACTAPAYIFTSNYNTQFDIKGNLYTAAFSDGEKKIFDAVMAIAPTGQPCMYDKVTKRPFYKSGSGSFIVGMTVEQARKLGKLPADATTKKLTVSLPASIVDGETVTDAAVQAALDAAAAKGWTITIQTYTES